LAVIALFSTANTVLILIMSSARLMYGMVQDGSLPRRLASSAATPPDGLPVLCGLPI
jgi:amino acid transporter